MVHVEVVVYTEVTVVEALGPSGSESACGVDGSGTMASHRVDEVVTVARWDVLEYAVV